MDSFSRSSAALVALSFLLLAVPAHVFAQPPANCVPAGDNYNCAVVANNQPVSLPFFVTSDDNETAYVVFCAYNFECSAEDSQGWLYVLAFSNGEGTQLTAYANVDPSASDPDFCDSAGYCIPTELLAESTCLVYDYCPGVANPEGVATFIDEDGDVITISASAQVAPTPITDPCTVGIYCDTSAIVFNGTSGTQIVISATANTPNLLLTEPASGTYTLLVPANATYSYTATLPSGSKVTGTVSSPSAYGEVTVVL